MTQRKKSRAKSPVKTGSRKRRRVGQEEGSQSSSFFNEWLVIPAKSTGEAIADASSQLTKYLKDTAETFFDFNEDGIADVKDVRLLTREVQRQALKIAKSDEVQGALTAAAIGSVVAVPVPLVGPALGGAAGVVVYFVYKGAEGLVKAGVQPFGSRRGRSRRSSKPDKSVPKFLVLAPAKRPATMAAGRRRQNSAVKR